MLTRRRFVEGVACGGALLALHRRSWGAPAVSTQTADVPALRGDEFDLVIEPTPINITGRDRLATAINGMVPRRRCTSARATPSRSASPTACRKWGFDGKKFAESEPIAVRLGERVRFVLINDTMMEHPIHLHSFLTDLENDQGL